MLTNIDDDHLVHYNNIFENLLDSFVMFLENIPFYGYMVMNGDDKNIKKFQKEFRKQITFGESKNCDYQIINIKASKEFKTSKFLIIKITKRINSD